MSRAADTDMGRVTTLSLVHDTFHSRPKRWKFPEVTEAVIKSLVRLGLGVFWHDVSTY